MSRIPRTFHFVFGLRPQTRPFHLVHYLCLRSCLEMNRPESVLFHYHYEPHGPLWDRIRPALELRRIEPETWVRDHPAYLQHEEGRFILGWDLSYAHQADFVRLRVLVEEGGVYADMDTLFVEPLPEAWFDQDFVIGEETVASADGGDPHPSLCNAFLMSRPGARFGRRWLERMRDVFDGTWSRHSCQEAVNLRNEAPGDVFVVPQRSHFKHPCTREGIRMLLEELDTDLGGVYSLHLWAHVWWSPLRTDFSRLHAGDLTEEYVRNAEATWAVYARRFLDLPPPPPGGTS